MWDLKYFASEKRLWSPLNLFPLSCLINSSYIINKIFFTCNSFHVFLSLVASPDRNAAKLFPFDFLSPPPPKRGEGGTATSISINIKHKYSVIWCHWVVILELMSLQIYKDQTTFHSNGKKGCIRLISIGKSAVDFKRNFSFFHL